MWKKPGSNETPFLRKGSDLASFWPDWAESPLLGLVFVYFLNGFFWFFVVPSRQQTDQLTPSPLPNHVPPKPRPVPIPWEMLSHWALRGMWQTLGGSGSGRIPVAMMLIGLCPLSTLLVLIVFIIVLSRGFST